MINRGRWRKGSNVEVNFVEISLGALLASLLAVTDVERLFSRNARNTPVDWYLPRKGEPPWCRATFDKTDLHAPCEGAYLHKYFPSYFLLSLGLHLWSDQLNVLEEKIGRSSVNFLWCNLRWILIVLYLSYFSRAIFEWFMPGFIVEWKSTNSIKTFIEIQFLQDINTDVFIGIV